VKLLLHYCVYARKKDVFKMHIEEEEVPNDLAREWLNKASRNKMNIFCDRNKIIVLLCRALLKERGLDPYRDEDFPARKR
jgi:hypothetical protein